MAAYVRCARLCVLREVEVATRSAARELLRARTQTRSPSLSHNDDSRAMASEVGVSVWNHLSIRAE
eukprot:1312568-Pleurochrysis_carterae.AAC.1